MPDQTTIYGYPGETPEANLTLALTASQKSWAFTGSTSRGAARPKAVLGFISDVAWHYSSRTGGPYLPVPAGAFVNLPVVDGQEIYVKAVSGTGNLSVVVTG